MAGPRGPQRVADRLAAAAADALVGRATEIDHLHRLLEAEDGPAVVFVNGAGGIGKSTLAAAVVARWPRGGIVVDGRTVEPTPARLVERIGAELGRPTVTDAEAVGGAVAEAGSPLLVLDTYERLAVADGWVRNELVPALPADTVTLLVGRTPPNLAWRTAPGWRHLTAEVVVGPLSDGDAAALLARRGLPADLTDRALHFGRGHPLALELAAEAFARHPDLELHDGPPPEVVEELVDVLFDDLEPRARRTVEAASILWRITEPLLGAVLEVASDPDAPPLDVATAWRTIRDLPFTRVEPYGLALNPIVGDVAASGLALRDPGRVRELRRRVARVALDGLASAPGWEATADLLHLVQNPVIRNAFLPPPGVQHPVETAQAEDGAAILAVVARHEGEEQVALARRWWDHHPECFQVSRGDGGTVRAFSIIIDAGAVDPGLADDDPVIATFRADLAARPLEAGKRALFIRWAIGAERAHELSPELAPMLIDVKRTYLELRPHLDRVYAVAGDWHLAGPMMTALGFVPLTDPDPSDGALGRPAVLDFGPGSVDGWLARNVEAETVAGPGPEGDGTATAAPGEPDRPALAVGGLSAREREVLAALAEGLTNRELAERLFISERTANRHLSNIFTKLGVRNRTAAARIAIEAGLAG